MQLKVLAPAFSDVGLTSSTLRFARPLTAGERRHVRVTLTNPSLQRIVVGAAKFQDHYRELVVVVAAAWIGTREGKRRHAFEVDATADAPGLPFVYGEPGAMVLAPALYPSRSAAAARATDGCDGLELLLRGSGRPALFSAPPTLRMPTHRIRDGSRYVPNGTIAGVFLDQVVGLACHHPPLLHSPWLRAALTPGR